MTTALEDPRPKKPLAEPGPWDLVSGGYDKYTRDFLAGFASKALDRLSLPDEARVVDVACGPGTSVLLLADRVSHIDALDFSAKMLEHCSAHLTQRGITNVALHHGDGMNLPLKEGQYDFGLSMFGLMFFPDRVQGMREFFRVLKPGGTVMIGSWAPAGRSPLMKLLFEVLQILDPTLPEPTEDVMSLENPEVFQKELEQAGFSDVRVEPVESSMEISDIDKFWQGMVEGSIPILLMKKRLSEEEWGEREKMGLQHLRKRLQLPAQVASLAYVGYGVKLER